MIISVEETKIFHDCPPNSSSAILESWTEK